MAIDALSVALLSFALALEGYIVQKIVQIERDIGFIKGYLKLNGGDPDDKAGEKQES